ncbi:1-acyl-sn-glycerol-3-phosphate acyltransferase [Lentibacillus sp. L22]|uniref:lysophospholipid acyltransferase family protein n=1 Tax=Lentibacillus TaxID=175304 RepID=UPI0022B19A3F|nr:1-acyl-sn-glycerol-3-phosphate acyltransferase [Lentibacillus daqui]
MYHFAASVLNIILSLFGRVKVYHKEKLPQKEGYIIACTHTGWVDILWLGLAVLPTKIHYMAKKELFEQGLIRRLMRSLNAFPVDRENPGPSSIKIPRRLIADGKVVGIFPSGMRTSEEVPLKRGAVTIASYAKAPIVPAAYVGPNNFKDLFKRKKPQLIFGDPIVLSKELPKKEALELMLKELNEEFSSLRKELLAKQ